MFNKMREWFNKATPTERVQLAEAAGTSERYLFNQIVGGHRAASAGLAADIEVAAAKLQAESDGRLPELTRMDVCAVCAECPYAIKCKGIKDGSTT